MMRRATLAAGGLLFGVAMLFGQAPIGERIPITDPDRLASLGLPRDATSVPDPFIDATSLPDPFIGGTSVPDGLVRR